MKRTMLALGAGLALTLSVGIFITCGGSKTPIHVSCKDTVPEFQTEKPKKLKVFLENSGSMDGYMCEGSKLKDAIYDYMTDLNNCTDTISLNYINSQVIPYENDLESYIKNLNPNSFKAAGGNRLNSDLAACIKQVLNQVDKNSVCMFISDCILDLPSGDATNYLNNCKISIKDAINKRRDKVKDLGVVIVKMMSNFDGKYYYPSRGDTPIKGDTLIKGDRPYYIWMFGDKKYLASIMSKVPFETELKEYGYENHVAYTNSSKPYFDIGNALDISFKKIKPNGSVYELMIAANLSTTLQSEEELKKTENYRLNNECKVDKVVASTKGDKYTHFIKFNVPQNCKSQVVTLSFHSPQPKWIDETNDTTGENIKANINKTTGIATLINGVAESYKMEKNISELTFKITKE
jgi:hypothetical protein